MNPPSLDFLEDSSILVTGGTGSFGQSFVRALLERSAAKRIIVFSRDELKQSQMRSTLKDPARRLRFFLGDVRDLERLQRAFHGIDYVVHAAALKQVPAIEYNPFEAVKTNVIGTQNVITAAIDRNVRKVLLISTDKAANPANLYGATKLCAERLMVSSNVYSAGVSAAFSVVRYGNVFGSRGSIVDIINDQRPTGEITLTHHEMTRFWITLGQGVDFVLFALENMRGGEVFVPKLPSMKVVDLIRALAPESRLRVIGIRPGEKIHETLVTAEEARRSKDYGTHYVIVPEQEEWPHAPHYAAASSLEDGFSFSSHTNTDWLDEDALKNFLS